MAHFPTLPKIFILTLQLTEASQSNIGDDQWKESSIPRQEAYDQKLQISMRLLV